MNDSFNITIDTNNTIIITTTTTTTRLGVRVRRAMRLMQYKMLYINNLSWLTEALKKVI